MTINADGYLNHLRSYLNLAKYGQTCTVKESLELSENQLMLSEKIEGTSKRRKVTLNYQGSALAIKLDQGNDPLYHFLVANEGHLWARRCDFVIFHAIKSRLNVYCIEFKEASTGIPVDNVMLQLKSSEAWCMSLNKIIAAYVGETKKMTLSKYVVTSREAPAPELDDSNQYLRKYPSIRHYNFDEINNTNLEDFENSSTKTIN